MTQPTTSIAKSRLPAALTALLLAFGVVACGGTSPNASDGIETDPDPTTTDAAMATEEAGGGEMPDDGPAVTRVEATLTGGTEGLAGDYAGASPVGVCSYGMQGDNDFYMTSSPIEPDATDPAHRNYGFTMEIEDLAAAESGTTDAGLLIYFGEVPSPDELSPSTTYFVDDTTGSIDVQLTDHGDGTATVSATGQAALLEIAPSDAPPLDFDLTVECLEITDYR